MSRPCLKRRHMLKRGYIKNLSRLSMGIRVIGPPRPMPMGPPSRKKKHGPLGQWTPLSKEQSQPGPLTRGGGGYMHGVHGNPTRRSTADYCTHNGITGLLHSWDG